MTHLAILYADHRDRSANARCSDCDFRRSPRSAYKIADIGRRHSPSVPVPAIFYGHCCEAPVKLTYQVGRFYHMILQNCHIAAIGEKNRQVCPHQVAKIDFRWRSNSLRWAYKIARCAAGFRVFALIKDVSI